MEISENTKAMLMLCTKTGLSENSPYLPYTLTEWNKLARRISDSVFGIPKNLIGETSENIQSLLDISKDEAERISRLLGRGFSLSIELERIQNLGIWVISRADKEYPDKFKQRLKEYAPPILFGAGELQLLETSGIAIVGSRNIDEQGFAFTESLGNIAAFHGLVVFSGGARGVDITAMKNALEGRGQSVGIMANSLEQAIKKPEFRNAILQSNLALLCPHGSNIGFNVGVAMGRNKLIYALSDYAVVVSSDLNEGGTWAGAIEALKNKWVPVFIRQCNPNIPGNRELILRGGLPISDPLPVKGTDLLKWLKNQKDTWFINTNSNKPLIPIQQQLFID